MPKAQFGIGGLLFRSWDEELETKQLWGNSSNLASVLSLSPEYPVWGLLVLPLKFEFNKCV